MARYFNVTTDYLLGISDVKKNIEDLMNTDNTLDECYDFVEVYKGLDKYDKEMVWLIIQTVKTTNTKRIEYKECTEENGRKC